MKRGQGKSEDIYPLGPTHNNSTRRINLLSQQTERRKDRWVYEWVE